MSERLLTMLQISDLHIGEPDPISGDAAICPATTNIVANLTWLDGVLGHHSRGLEDLDDFYWKLVDEGERPLIMMTGDLTRVGSASDFKVAEDFLDSQVDLTPPSGNVIGLADPSWRAYAIPGNHDHWSGKATVWGGPTAAFHNCFPAMNMPFVRSMMLSNGRRLQMAGINTDAQVSPRGLKRLRALGSFQKQLQALAPMLGKRQDADIRVLLMHHSWYHRGMILSIDRASRGALDQFLLQHGIQVLLTGHTHKRKVRPFVPRVSNATEQIYECRCGTSSQVDQVPPHWANLFGWFPKRKWPENSLLLHRLKDDRGTTRWDTQVYVRDRTNGFVATAPHGQYTWTV